MSPFSPVDLRGFPCQVTRLDDVVYASPNGKPLLADLYLPDEPVRPLPTILFLHAGGWLAGDRRLGPDLSRFFAERGFAMVSIDYRLSKEAVFPAALHDVVTAIQWLRSSAPIYGLDPGRIGLWGASAGAHLAALAALAAPETEVQAVVAVYPPVDFLRMGEQAASPKSYESRFLGAPLRTVPELVARANPARYARAGAPPFLLVHGRNDTAVPVGQSEILYEALRAGGNHVTLSVIEGLGHEFLHDNHFDQGPPRRHFLRASRPGETEQSVEAPPLTFGTIEAFFRRHL
ncbi:MAG: alpha/beta hydrolase [Acidobacteriota bacterium]